MHSAEGLQFHDMSNQPTPGPRECPSYKEHTWYYIKNLHMSELAISIWMHNVRINPTIRLLPNIIVENVHNRTVLVWYKMLQIVHFPHFPHLCTIITACAPNGKRYASSQSPWVVVDFSTPQKSHMALPYYYYYYYTI